MKASAREVNPFLAGNCLAKLVTLLIFLAFPTADSGDEEKADNREIETPPDHLSHFQRQRFT